MLRQILLRASENAWLRERLPRSKMTRGAVLRFIPGEDLQVALTAGDDLGRHGLTNFLSYLGENVSNAEEADSTADEYASAIDGLGKLDQGGEISLKLTQIGLDLGRDACHGRLRGLVAHASRVGVTIWIDMEGSAYTDVTLDIYRRLRSEFDNVGVCLQAYLYRSLADLQSLLPLRPAIRIVKGAYTEPARLAYPYKPDVDTSFVALATELLRERARNDQVRIAFGTHDDRLIARIADVAERTGVPRNAYEVQLLYGIRENYQRQLAADGYAVRILISYGEAWFPWFMRRLAERPSNLRFLLRGLF